jgi:glycerol-3-phosphate responsive antiterminator
MIENRLAIIQDFMWIFRIFIIDKIASQSLVKQKKANNVILILNCSSIVKFLKLKCFYTEKYYEKQKK